MKINFSKKPYLFNLSKKVINSKIKILNKKGWIIQLKNEKNVIGYGEVSPLKPEHLALCKNQLDKIPSQINENIFINEICRFHPCIQSAVNIALGEIRAIVKYKKNYDFDDIHKTAILVDSRNILDEVRNLKNNNTLVNKEITLKWKVGTLESESEEKILEKILSEINNKVKLRIDANGSWDRKYANRWAEILKDNVNLDWLEQPLSEDDLEGLRELEKRIPVALDESIIKYPDLTRDWKGWQIRRPSQEINPLILLKELEQKKGLRIISTSFETGIGMRVLNHFSSIQQIGPTPKVPGLALRNFPKTILFSNNPNDIWKFL